MVLDRTAFYPTSGGQPFDTGRLGGAQVVDVVDEDGEVVHVLDAPLTEGASVAGEIDRTRRFDHMQQHTGQHVLSASFDRLFDNRTLSFHLGSDVSTIDLARELSPAEIDRAVAEANRVVWEDRSVSIRFVSSDEAAELPLRKEPAREGTLRLIEVADFDLSACGGTHVARTGAIGVIAVLGSERLRGGARVTFVCGGRALRMFGVYRDAIAGTTRFLSVPPGELPSAVERVQGEARDLRRALSRLQESLAGHEAARLLLGAEEIAGIRVLVAAVDGWDAAGLKSIASAAVADGGVVTMLVSGATPASAVIARSQGVDVDAGKILRELLSRFGGRGGGKPELAQGGGLTGAAADVVSAARLLIERALLK